MEDTTKGLLVANYVWDTTTLAWVKEVQSLLVTDSLYLALDEVEALLTTIDADTGAMVTDLAAIEVLLGTIDADTSALFGCVDGTELQVDVVSMPGSGIATTPDASDVSAAGSTTTALNANSVWTTAAIDCEGFASVGITLTASHDSAADGMKFRWSSDGTNWDDIYSFNLDFSESPTRRFQFPVCARYFSIEYTNGGTNQTYFRVQTILHRTPIRTSIHTVESTIVGDRSVELVKTVIAGETTAGGGGYVNVKVDPAGKLAVEAAQEDTTWAVQDSANATLLTSILADTATMDTSLASAVILLGTIDTDTGNILTDTTAIKNAVQIMDDWDLNDRCRVSPISGQDGVAGGAGAVAATVQRVTLASDDPAVVDLAALEVLETDKKDHYFFDSWLISGDTAYVAMVDKGGNYYIQKIDTSSGDVTYEAGTGGVPAQGAWGGLSYQTYDAEF
jgi:hypothetical protein